MSRNNTPSKSKKSSETPLMQQYNAIKAKHPEALLLFRVGDFYETFNDDAIKASRILGIVLTKRSNGAASSIELAGFPYHSLETYLPKLIRAGERVAICEQLEDPKTTKTIVKRGVTELITPGVAMDEKILINKENNFLAAITVSNDVIGVALVDISTGEFLCAEGTADYIERLFSSLNPKELIYCRKDNNLIPIITEGKYYTFKTDDWVFEKEQAREQLLRHFKTSSLKGFGIEDHDLAVSAAGAIIHYLKQNYQEYLDHIRTINRIDENNFVWLDKFTVRNLEITHTLHDNGTSLVDVIDQTVTPMGGRLLRKWSVMPLLDIKEINKRHAITALFLENSDLRDHIKNTLAQVGDLERLISRVALRKSTPRELSQLCSSMKVIKPLKERLVQSANIELSSIASLIDNCEGLATELERSLNPDPPAVVSKGNVIAAGYSTELDELRAISGSGKQFLVDIQQREIEKTGITSLKIGFNNVFGYYIEVTNAHKSKVPSDWIRKQTLVNAERYITGELKEYEEKILGAEEKISELELQLFAQVVEHVAGFIPNILKTAAVLANLDCLTSFAQTAFERNYVKPEMNDSLVIDIKDGRHPVLEAQLPPGEAYIPNDVYLDNEQQQIIIITGPNMSGKSALLRQTALIVLMAQIGSFVPASAANIGLVDKIFTRVGASDNISSGESTFMVEMNETASILNNLSARSLVVLDEIGRGTATYDGISIAWSIAEYLHDQKLNKPRTLFATHYHELNELAGDHPGIKNYHVSVKETGTNILFLRKLVPGGSEHSFGIHVAKLAGMPLQVTLRAEDILQILEKAHSGAGLHGDNNYSEIAEKEDPDGFQLSFFQLDDPLLEQIRDEILETDINSLTPVEALMKLNSIKQVLVNKSVKKGQKIASEDLLNAKNG